jgi:hypothetical protein
MTEIIKKVLDKILDKVYNNIHENHERRCSHEGTNPNPSPAGG